MKKAVLYRLRAACGKVEDMRCYRTCEEGGGVRRGVYPGSGVRRDHDGRECECGRAWGGEVTAEAGSDHERLEGGKRCGPGSEHKDWQKGRGQFTREEGHAPCTISRLRPIGPANMGDVWRLRGVKGDSGGLTRPGGTGVR
ncbi:hypothetical protein FB45DRAFT_1014397 [Roridomyces roridus]|uniref:Uncharacterized protein n=1 Tax=Roridomyces roridus TaxID=1738132 RepID=A0AAD7AY42_9AGAR|nr:hypothetical protein FB45DRAFT_1014397 [Roridomyces roridus]